MQGAEIVVSQVISDFAGGWLTRLLPAQKVINWEGDKALVECANFLNVAGLVRKLRNLQDFL